MSQAEFNTRFKAAQSSRQAEVDKILDASNRMKEIWEEQGRVASGAGEGSLFKPRGGLDDSEDSVLSVRVCIAFALRPILLLALFPHLPFLSLTTLCSLLLQHP